MRRRKAWILAAAVLPLGVAGCGSNNGLHLARVSGKVTFDSEPIKNGTIIFEPDESKGTTGPLAIGTIKSDGTYILSSESSGDGAVVGSHKVGILALSTEPVTQVEMPKPEDDPLKYLSAKTKVGIASAKASVKKNAERTVTGLDGKTFKILVPEKVTSSKTSGIMAKVDSGSNTINIEIDKEGVAQIK